MKHTPGPWHIGNGTRIIGANSQRVAVCDNNAVTQGMDNARLIAAAPDILGALIWVVQLFDQHDDCANIELTMSARNNARAAIAKAKGEST